MKTLKEILWTSLYFIIMSAVFYALFSIGNSSFDYNEWSAKTRWTFGAGGTIMYLDMLCSD